VCVVGEANAWPYRSTERTEGHPDELVHWVGHRIGSGETFDAIARPRFPISPSTPAYVGLARDALAAGGGLDELFEAWRAFVRDDDVVCSWGRYATRLFVTSGGWLPPSRVDLRLVARQIMKGKVGTIEHVVERLSAAPGLDLARGRAGLRAAQSRAIALRYVEVARSASGVGSPT